ncbi:MAG TPA: DHA2 family efflux MFS transporter permease subunit [Streptosporangiaceae bacterium]
MSSVAAEERISRRTWLALVAMALGVFLIANDITALTVAIGRIETDLHTSLNRAQWVINGYALVFGVLIVTGGRLADLFGRKRIFMIGAAIFALFSLLTAVMPNVDLVIACRALMGIGGALVWPAVLGLTYTILPEGRKGLAGGLIIGVAGLGNAVGPLLGGWLTDAASWRLIFLINLPITALAMFVTQREVPESEVAGAERGIDYTGVTLLSLGAVAVLLALDIGTVSGFGSPLVVALIVAGLVVLTAFFLIERRQGDAALIPADVLRSRIFSAACVTVLLMSAIFFAALLFLPQFMERSLGFSPLRAGAGLLPLMCAFAAVSFAAGSLYGRLGAKVSVTAGGVFLAAGIFLLSFLSRGSGYASLIPGMIVLGIGIGLFYSSVTTAAVTALDPARSSLAGGIVYMCQVAGGAIGLGLNTAIALSAGTLVDGIRVAFRVDAVLAAAGVAVCLAFVHGPRRSAAHAAVPPAHHRVHTSTLGRGAAAQQAGQ